MLKKLFGKKEESRKTYKEQIDYANLQIDQLERFTMEKVNQLNDIIIEMSKG